MKFFVIAHNAWGNIYKLGSLASTRGVACLVQPIHKGAFAFNGRAALIATHFERSLIDAG
jgi:hypothetical protein